MQIELKDGLLNIQDKDANFIDRPIIRQNKNILKSKLEYVTHAEDTEFLSSEMMSTNKIMLAGAIAGSIEHICTFPIDTIKTYMQAYKPPDIKKDISYINTKNTQEILKNTKSYNNIKPTTILENIQSIRNKRYNKINIEEKLPYVNKFRTIRYAYREILNRGGIRQQYRGLSAALLGAIPSHAAYFMIYEYTHKITGASNHNYTPVANLLSGIGATMAHDAIVVPADVIKQRMQLRRYHSNVFNCLKTIIQKEGLSALYTSYTTTLVLNIPYISAFFTALGATKTLFNRHIQEYPTIGTLISGACAGMCGGAASTPQDVIKTRIQTYNLVPGTQPPTAWDITKEIYRTEKLWGFTRGIQARILLCMPSAALCWGSYELMKHVIPGFTISDI